MLPVGHAKIGHQPASLKHHAWAGAWGGQVLITKIQQLQAAHLLMFQDVHANILCTLVAC